MDTKTVSNLAQQHPEQFKVSFIEKAGHHVQSCNPTQTVEFMIRDYKEFLESTNSENKSQEIRHFNKG